jgi:hypothetical protein
MMKGLDSLAPEKVLGMETSGGERGGRRRRRRMAMSNDSNWLGKLDEEKQRRIEEAEKLRLEQERLKAEAERKVLIHFLLIVSFSNSNSLYCLIL